MNPYNSDGVRWAMTCGGPLVVLSRPLLSRWLGGYLWCDEPDDVDKSQAFQTPEGWLCSNEDFMNPQESDYGRACDTDSLRSLIPVAGEEALVLGNEDNDDGPATWFPLPQEQGAGLVICQWNYLHSSADQSQLVRDVVGNLEALDWEDEVFWHIGSSELVMFDSASAGALVKEEDDDCLFIPLQPGKYSLSTATYNLAPDFQILTLHRLRLAPP